MGNTRSYRTPKRRLFSVPVPEETRTYKPVSYKSLAKTTLRAIRDAGFTVDAEEYSSAREGLNATGRYLINMGDPEMALEIVWQNSYDKRLTVKFAIGTRVFVCANGCVSGDFGAFKRKHMGDVREFTMDDIARIVEKSGEIFARMVSERDIMKAIPCNNNLRAEILGRLYLETDILSTHLLNTIKNEIANPTHDYGAPDSLWDIYQHITFAMKNIHPTLWMSNHIAVHEFFMNYAKEYIGTNMDNLPETLDGNTHVSTLFEEYSAELEARTIDVETIEVVDAEEVDPDQLDMFDGVPEREEEIVDFSEPNQEEEG